eukprot:6180271-Pleurochrysis_carterae.AAC.2
MPCQCMYTDIQTRMRVSLRASVSLTWCVPGERFVLCVCCLVCKLLRVDLNLAHGRVLAPASMHTHSLLGMNVALLARARARARALAPVCADLSCARARVELKRCAPPPRRRSGSHLEILIDELSVPIIYVWAFFRDSARTRK